MRGQPTKRTLNKGVRAELAREANAELEFQEALVAEVRANPEQFSGTEAIACRSGISPTRLSELFRQHHHISPDDLLLRARHDASKRRLLISDDSLTRVARDVGFRSVPDFQESFLRLAGLTPGAYRKLPTAQPFRIQLPAGYPLHYLRRALGRDHQSVSERLENDVYTAAIRLGNEPHILRLNLSPTQITASVTPPTAEMPRLHAMVVGMLGLDQETAAFVRHAERLGLTRLVAGCPELRIHQTPSVFDGLLWAIIGQQINMAFAFLLRRRLFEFSGTPMGHGLYAPPTPEMVANFQPADLLPLQYSRQKADYIISVSRLIAAGGFNPDSLHTMSATRAERTLLSIRGLGIWSVNYVMMRSLGFADCLPVGDTGVTSSLKALFELEQRPDMDATRRLTAQFSPYRSLATAHLWQFNQPVPDGID